MANAQQADVVIAPDSTGKAVRTLSITTLLNEAPVTVQMQVVSIADEDGNILGDLATNETVHTLYCELRAIRCLLQQALGVRAIPDIAIS